MRYVSEISTRILREKLIAKTRQRVRRVRRGTIFRGCSFGQNLGGS
jgi:hypothetical protein